LKIHLIDGTYELFRCYFGAPPARTQAGREVGATRGLVHSLAAWLRGGEVTHAAVAFDHVIESFRNDLFAGYKTGEGLDPDLFAQFELAERAVAAMGITVWPMIPFEADDALAAGAAKYAGAKGVEQVLLVSPDKDLTQCVRDNVVVFDRHRAVTLDHAGVVAKFGVPPAAIPDLHGLVGDTADGIPGIPKWGMKSAGVVLSHFGTIEAIPDDAALWGVKVRGAESLAATLKKDRQAALLYKKLATLRADVPLAESVADLAWHGADRPKLEDLADEIEDRGILERVTRYR
jgi:5'-3' exonuclease